MIVRLARPEDREGWNRVAKESPHATYGHTWEWKQALEKGLNVHSLSLVAEDKGAIVGIYPAFLWPRFERNGQLVWLKTFLLGKAQVLWSPFHRTSDYGGPCLLPGTSPQIHADLLSAMEGVAKKQHALEIRVAPVRDAGLENALSTDGYRMTERLTALVDLTKSEDELWKNLKQDTRNQVRQAKKNGLEITEETGAECVDSFYSCLQSVADRTVMGMPPKAFFEAVFEILVPAKIARFYTIKHEGKTIMSALFMCHNGNIVVRWWGALKETLKLRPYNGMAWHIMVAAKQMGFHTFDFGGMPQDEENGIHRFKKGWGVRIEHADWYIKPIGVGKAVELTRKMLGQRNGK